jgi:hypothetical protein
MWWIQILLFLYLVKGLGPIGNLLEKIIPKELVVVVLLQVRVVLPLVRLSLFLLVRKLFWLIQG